MIVPPLVCPSNHVNLHSSAAEDFLSPPYTSIALTMMMETAAFSETLENPQNWARLIPES
jgi:hypothetical protein